MLRNGSWCVDGMYWPTKHSGQPRKNSGYKQFYSSVNVETFPLYYLNTGLFVLPLN